VGNSSNRSATIIEQVKETIDRLWPVANFDCLAYAVVDFKKNEFQHFEWEVSDSKPRSHHWFFDLASVTKPLVLATSYLLRPEIFKKEESIWCLEHRAGLPAWGRLGPDDWRKRVSTFPLSHSETLYSDYSALRAQLLAEWQLGGKLYDLIKQVHDKEVFHWTELPKDAHSPVTGMRNGKAVCGQVHDDNAFYIREKVAHAGLFASAEGLAKTLLNLHRETNFLEKVDGFIQAQQKISRNQRFVRGWDRVLDSSNTLAGKGASEKVFGHLGFTGTSIWMDSEKAIGQILLTNGTKNYWYAKEGLNQMRREIGAITWKLG